MRDERTSRARELARWRRKLRAPRSLGIPGTVALSVAALFGLGVATSLFNARSACFSGLRQVVIGAAAAAVTYPAGRAFGALSATAL
jgi:VIT1/CCC1 family predicted Fe2+/Mn2+ transporter